MDNLSFLRQNMLPAIMDNLYPHAAKMGPGALDNRIYQRVQEIVNELLEANRKRLAEDFKSIETESQQRNVVSSLGAYIAKLMIENAVYENRKEIVLGDLYLAMLNFRTIAMWPWTGEKKR